MARRRRSRGAKTRADQGVSGVAGSVTWSGGVRWPDLGNPAELSAAGLARNCIGHLCRRRLSMGVISVIGGFRSCRLDTLTFFLFRTPPRRYRAKALPSFDLSMQFQLRLSKFAPAVSVLSGGVGTGKILRGSFQICLDMN